jgi:hypothetical protein
MSEPSAKRFKYQYTTEQKCWLVDFTENNPKLGAEDLGQKLAEHVNAGRARDQLPVEPPKKNTVNDWRRDRVALRAKLHTSLARGGKRDKKAKYPELEEALQLWFKQQEQRGLTVQDEHFRGQAIRFAEGLKIPVTGDNAFLFSNGWLDGFKKRKGIKSFVQHGEAGSANAAGIELARRSVRKLVEGLNPGDIFNQDESGLFWRQPPSRTLATGKKAGRKKDKQRVTASLLVNATGTEKLPLFLIGKAKRPRSFPKNDEVFEAMTDDEIVRNIVQMVDTQGADDADSNEDEADDCQACKLTTAQAMGLAAELHDFVLSHPDQFAAEQADVLQGLQRQLAKMFLGDKRQTYMTSFFDAKL